MRSLPSRANFVGGIPFIALPDTARHHCPWRSLVRLPRRKFAPAAAGPLGPACYSALIVDAAPSRISGYRISPYTDAGIELHRSSQDPDAVALPIPQASLTVILMKMVTRHHLYRHTVTVKVLTQPPSPLRRA